jgi:hypothetical protein
VGLAVVDVVEEARGRTEDERLPHQPGEEDHDLKLEPSTDIRRPERSRKDGDGIVSGLRDAERSADECEPEVMFRGTDADGSGDRNPQEPCHGGVACLVRGRQDALLVLDHAFRPFCRLAASSSMIDCSLGPSSRISCRKVTIAVTEPFRAARQSSSMTSA